MLTLNQIKNTYKEASIQKHQERMALVEYIQHELLDSIFKQKKSTLLSFMGGTCLRIVYSGNRFSEDLDFDNFGLSFEDFKGLLDDVVKDMKIKGFEIEFRFTEKQAYHCYIKFPKILQNNSLSPNDREKILVRIDTIPKEKLSSPDVFLLKRFDLYRNIYVNSPSIILSQKLIAILDRKREKGRDFYDVSFLYGFTEPNFDFIEKTVSMNKKTILERIIARCSTLDFKALAKDVEPFLIQPDQSARVETFLEFIKSKV